MASESRVQPSLEAGSRYQNELLGAISRFRRRIQTVNAASSVPRAVAAVCFAALIGQLLGLRLGSEAASGAVIGLGGLAALALLAGGLLVRPSRLRAALEFDSRLGLKERLSTAIELVHRPDRFALAQFQVADAARHAAGIDPRKAYPFRFSRLDTGLAVMAALLLVAWNFLPRESGIGAAIGALVAGGSDGEAVSPAAPPDALGAPQGAESGPISRAERLQTDRLRQSLEQLRDASNPEAREQQQRLGAVGEALRRTSVARDAGRKLTGADYAGAAEALRELAQAIERMNSSERQELIAGLRESAELAAGDQMLSTQLKDAAAALENFRNSTAAETLQQIADRIEEDAALLASENAVQQRINELERALREAGGADADQRGQPGEAEGAGSEGSGESPGGATDETGSGAGLTSGVRGSEVETIEEIGVETRLDAEGNLEIVALDPNAEAPTEKFERPVLQLGRDIDVSLNPSAGELGAVRARPDTTTLVPLDVAGVVSGYFSSPEGQ